jgi:hypothetical protein
VLDYDTNLIRGPKDKSVTEAFVENVKKHPLPPEQFIKHYILTDKSGQTLDHLQIIQVELPRAEQTRPLFPPQADFTLMDWWVSILRHSQDYSSEEVAEWYAGGKGIMPEEIHKALNRLDFQRWDPTTARAYKVELIDRDAYATTLAVEKEEGMEQGIVLGEKRGIVLGEKRGEKRIKRATITQMRSMDMQDSFIAQALQITEQQLQELMTEEIVK